MRALATILARQPPQLAASTVFKAWYALFFASQVCLLPYIVLHFQRSGLTPQQIGALLALQPWISAPAGFLWSWLADRTNLHKFLLLVNLPTSIFLRASIVLSNCKTCFVLLVVMTEITAAPVTALVDVAAVSSCAQDADYGKLRLWGGVGWGVFSVIAGWIIERHGLTAAVVPYFILAAPCVLLTGCMNTWSPSTGTGQQQASQQPTPQADNHTPPTPAAPDLQMALRPTTSTTSTDEVTLHDQTHSHLPLPGDVYRRKPTPGINKNTLLTDLDDIRQTTNIAASDKGRHSGNTPAAVHPVHGSVEASSVQQYVHEGQSGAEYPHEGTIPPRSGRGPPASVVGGSGARNMAGLDCSEQVFEHDVEHLPTLLKDVEAGTVHEAGRVVEVAGSMTGVGGLMRLLNDPQVLCFLFLGTLMGYGLGQLGSFFFLLLEELHGSKTLMGLTLAVTCMSEIPVFQLQSFMLQYISLNVLLHIVALSYVVRLLCYGLLPWWGTPWAVLPVELLHGLTFACAWGLGTVQARRLAHPGLETTMQGLFQSVFFGVGAGLGALVGGILSNRYGFQVMYFIGSGTMLLGYLVYAALQQLVNACAAKHRPTATYSPVATDELMSL